jgi:hypothetical protein
MQFPDQEDQLLLPYTRCSRPIEFLLHNPVAEDYNLYNRPFVMSLTRENLFQCFLMLQTEELHT